MKRKPNFTWEELERIVGPALQREKAPGSVTSLEYAERYGIADHTAQIRLNRLVAKGILEKLPFLTPSGRKAFCYRVRVSKSR